MTAYVGGRCHDYSHNRRFRDSGTDSRNRHDDDLDFDLNGRRRSSSRNRKWLQRRSLTEPEIENELFDARATKLSALQHHLEELKEDNRQMSLRLSQAEGCLQDLGTDDVIVRHSSSLIDGDDRRPVSERKSLSEKERQHRLRRELRDIRNHLDAVRDTLQQQQTAINGDHLYVDGGRDMSPSARRRVEDITWTRQRSDLDAFSGSRSRRSHSPVLSVSPTARSASCVGYRSVVPRPLLTQTNKFQYSPLTSRRFDASYVNDDAVFIPSSAADLSIGDRVKVSRNGRTSNGLVKYIGHLPGKVGPYLGLELENEAGKHDGIFNGFRYFQCKGFRGVFVPFDRVVLAWRQ